MRVKNEKLAAEEIKILKTTSNITGSPQNHLIENAVRDMYEPNQYGKEP